MHIRNKKVKKCSVRTGHYRRHVLNTFLLCMQVKVCMICWHTQQVFELLTTGFIKLFSKSCASFWSNHYLEIKNVL